MTSVVVTGASGFVGQYISRYLPSEEVEVISMDLRRGIDPDMVNRADVVLHLAGKAHDLKNVSAPEDYYKVNFELTREVYDAFLGSPGKTFIMLSSVKAVRDCLHGEVLTEEMTPLPQTHYGESKRLAEEYIQANAVSGQKSAFILRPCMIHGPGNKGNLNLLYRIASKGIPWPLGAFENKRSFCSIDNLCFVIKEIISRSDVPGGIYNVADDDPVSTNELIELIAACQMKKARILSFPKGFIRRIAAAGDYLALPLNTERLQKLTESYVVDNGKLLNVIGKRLPFSAYEGLMKTILSFKYVE